MLYMQELLLIQQITKYTFGELGSRFYYLKAENKKALKCYKVDYDNIIPITDEEYFQDDIVGLFCDWLKKLYEAEGKKTVKVDLLAKIK